LAFEGFRQRLPRRLALGRCAIPQQVQGRLDRKFAAGYLEAQAGDGLIEQPVPGGIAALDFS